MLKTNIYELGGHHYHWDSDRLVLVLMKAGRNDGKQRRSPQTGKLQVLLNGRWHNVQTVRDQRPDDRWKYDPNLPDPRTQPGYAPITHQQLIERGKAIASKFLAGVDSANEEWKKQESSLAAKRDAARAVLLKAKGEEVRTAKAAYDKALQNLDDAEAIAKSRSIDSMRIFREYLLSTGLDDAEAQKLSDRVEINPQVSAWISEETLRGQMKEFFKITGGKGANVKRLVKEQDRACAYRDTRTINMGSAVPDQGKLPVLWHELGHFVEFDDFEYVDASTRWVKGKATGEPKSLNEIFGGRFYDEGESAYPGDFIHPYVSRVYPQKDATEVISMGLERFCSQEAMLNLYQKDSEHFYLILGVLQS